MPHKLTATLLLFFCCAMLTVSSCKKKLAMGTDRDLYNMAKDTAGFTWYKNSDTLLAKSANSAHAFPLIRTRFNDQATNRLDVYDKVKTNAHFPEGSLIVKEMCDKTGKIMVYTTLWKNTDCKDADENGWVWGAVSADGYVEISATKKGSACISCHQQEGNLDNVLMNKYFP